MEPGLWAKAHGAATHFPIALTLVSVACDASGFVFVNRPVARDLHATGYWAMLLGALGSVPAVASGLLMTKGGLLGHGALRWHHLFVWPAFALLIALATWRAMVGQRATRRMFTGYLVAVSVMVGLMAAAGYWGGELMIAR